MKQPRKGEDTGSWEREHRKLGEGPREGERDGKGRRHGKGGRHGKEGNGGRARKGERGTREGGRGEHRKGRRGAQEGEGRQEGRERDRKGTRRGKGRQEGGGQVCVVHSGHSWCGHTLCFSAWGLTVCHNSAANVAAHPFPEGVAHIDSMRLPLLGSNTRGPENCSHPWCSTCSRPHRKACQTLACRRCAVLAPFFTASVPRFAWFCHESQESSQHCLLLLSLDHKSSALPGLVLKAGTVRGSSRIHSHLQEHVSRESSRIHLRLLEHTRDFNSSPSSRPVLPVPRNCRLPPREEKQTTFRT